MNAPRTPAEIMKERFAAAVIHTPHSAPEAQHAEEDPDHHRNAPRPDPACLYGLLGRVAEAGSETTEANPYAVALNALVYLSAGIGRGPAGARRARLVVRRAREDEALRARGIRRPAQQNA